MRPLIFYECCARGEQTKKNKKKRKKNGYEVVYESSPISLPCDVKLVSAFFQINTITSSH